MLPICLSARLQGLQSQAREAEQLPATALNVRRLHSVLPSFVFKGAGTILDQGRLRVKVRVRTRSTLSHLPCSVDLQSLFLEGADGEAAEEEDAEGGEGAAGGHQPQRRLQRVVLGDEHQRPCARGRRKQELAAFAGTSVIIMGRGGGSDAVTSAWPSQ